MPSEWSPSPVSHLSLKPYRVLHFVKVVKSGDLCHPVRALMNLNLLVIYAGVGRVNHHDFLTERLVEVMAIALWTWTIVTKGHPDAFLVRR